MRPSYVLSGAAMSVAHEPNELRRILAKAKRVSQDYPVVVSKFETHAREVEVDAVADGGELVLWAISEHIEDAGVHSGDATLVLPPQTLYIATIRRVRKIASQVARALEITGPFNMQFLAKHNAVKVIECNLRASRSFPFVSKVIGQNFAAEATRRMLGIQRDIVNRSLDLDYVGVKAPMFSFSRLVGADPLLGVEMASTGEVGCLGEDVHEALLHALTATGFRPPQNGVLLSLGPVADKYWFADEAKVIAGELNLPIFATAGTAEALAKVGVDCVAVEKTDGSENSALALIETGRVDLVINVPVEFGRARPTRRLHDPTKRRRQRRPARYGSATRPGCNRSTPLQARRGSGHFVVERIAWSPTVIAKVQPTPRAESRRALCFSTSARGPRLRLQAAERERGSGLAMRRGRPFRLQRERPLVEAASTGTMSLGPYTLSRGHRGNVSRILG